MESNEKHVLFDSRVRRDKESKKINYLTEKILPSFSLDEAMVVDVPKSNVIYDKVIGDYAPMMDLLETLISGGLEIKRKGVKPRFHPYRGQQVDLANLPTLYYCDSEVTEIIFPPAGFDYMTKKYKDSTVFNTCEGYLIRDKPAHVVNFVQDYDVTEEESVIFTIRTYDDIHYLRWTAEYIEWLLVDEPIGYYRKHDGVWLNYSTHHEDNSVDPKSMSSSVVADLLVNVDGVSLIVPRCPMSVYRVFDHVFYDSAGAAYGVSDKVDGTYLCNNETMEVLCSTLLPADSTQSINVMNDNVWTVRDMLDYWSFPKDFEFRRFTSINYFEKWMDTFDLECYQMKQNQHKISFPASKQDLIHNYFAVSAGYSEFDLNSYLSACGVVKRNSLFLPYRDLYDCKLWNYNGSVYTRVRNGGKRIYVKKKYKEVNSGWWYQYPAPHQDVKKVKIK